MTLGQTSFAAICLASGLPEPVPEYQFAPPRLWRMDFAWVEQRLCLEIQGGLFTQGRHTRGAALLREYEKLNAACCKGWRVLLATPEQVSNGAILATVVAALRG